MRRLAKILLLAIVVLLPKDTFAQSDVERFFVAMPDSLLPILPRAQRNELVMLSRGGVEAVVENLFGETARLTFRSANRISVEPTRSSRFEICSLPTDSQTLFLSIYTLSQPVPHSRLAVYDAEGTEVKGVFAVPDLHEFLTAPDSTIYLQRRYWAERLLPLHIEAQFEDDPLPTLRMEVRTNGLSLEERNDVQTAFRSVRRRWTNGVWK